MLESSVTSSVLKGGTGEWRAAKVTVTRVKLMLSFRGLGFVQHIDSHQPWGSERAETPLKLMPWDCALPLPYLCAPIIH